MSLINLNDVYKQVILDHSKYPRNFGEKDTDDYIKIKKYNPSCGDKINVYIKLNNKKIVDIKFTGTGCAISMASASMMCEELKGDSLDTAKKKIENFLNMIIGEKFDETLLEDSISLKNISKLPSRVKCATLGWKVLEELLILEENNFE